MSDWFENGQVRLSPKLNQIDPLTQIEDLADIVTYVTTLPSVDPRLISLWGKSFGELLVHAPLPLIIE